MLPTMRSVHNNLAFRSLKTFNMPKAKRSRTIGGDERQVDDQPEPNIKQTGNKKQSSSGEQDAASKTSSSGVCNPKRVRNLRAGTQGPGPVIYWMSRDQRVADNWALLHAADAANKKGAPLAVAFNLV
jgi:hypothetical protein